MSDSDDRILVVLQLGSTQVRCGLSGDDAPRRQLVHVINGRNPVKEGILQDPEDFVTIVRGSVGEDMDCATETRGIIVCDPPTNTPESRKMLASVLFDVFHFPAVRFFSRTPLCALSACITTALVVEFGDEHTYVMPVVGCVGIRHALKVGPIAGRQITAWLMKKVQAYNPSLVLQDKLGFNNIGGIKHQCPVAPSKEAYTETYQAALAEEKAFFEESAKKSSEKSNGGASSSTAQPAEGEMGYVLLGSVKHQDTDAAVHEIKLPPAGILTAAPEALFQPQLLLPDDNKAARGSLAELIVDSIRAIDAETATPELIVELYSHVVIAGRGCMFPGGFAERLTSELTPLAAAAHGVQDVTVIADPARSSGAWVGASVLSSMRDTEANGFVTNAMWEAHGPSIFDSWSTE